MTARNCHRNYALYCLKHLIFTQKILLLHKLFPMPEISQSCRQGPSTLSLPWARDHHFCVTLEISTASQPHPWDCVHIIQVQSLLFLAESIFLQAKSFTVLSLTPAIHKCQRVTHRIVKWKGMGTETSRSQGDAARRLSPKPKGFSYLLSFSIEK